MGNKGRKHGRGKICEVNRDVEKGDETGKEKNQESWEMVKAFFHLLPSCVEGSVCCSSW